MSSSHAGKPGHLANATPVRSESQQPTVVVFGLQSHPVLGELYARLQSRGRRRVVYAALENFPEAISFGFSQKEGQDDGFFQWDGDAPVRFSDIVSVCLDGYAIVAGGEGLSAEDQEYRQTESWAALVALFRGLSRQCLVANHVVERDHFHSRLAELYLLHSYALPVPRVLVTSNADQARAFIDQVGSVIYRTVMGKDLPFRPLLPEDKDRLDEVGLAPVHFEEHPEGGLAGLIRVGPLLVASPREADIPQDLRQGFEQLCRDLGLELAELRLRQLHDGRGWQALGLHPFLSQEGLNDPEVAEAALDLLEYGGPT